MKTIYNSDKLEITKQDGKFKVTDKLSGQWSRLNFFGWFFTEHARIRQWNFCKQYPAVMPALVDLGELKKWKNGFRIKIEGDTYYYDMQMVYHILKYGNGTTHYLKYNKRHRIDGPAIEYADGGKQWWINGNLYRTDDVEQWMTENSYTYPFDKPVQAQFILKFV